MCRQPADKAFRPFCSKRCADVDLGRWFSGRYVVKDEDADATDTSAAPGPVEEE
jgi:endogenous inhibitor of DNA gyrase (YacG/DUF329 family)